MSLINFSALHFETVPWKACTNSRAVCIRSSGACRCHFESGLCDGFHVRAVDDVIQEKSDRDRVVSQIGLPDPFAANGGLALIQEYGKIPTVNSFRLQFICFLKQI